MHLELSQGVYGYYPPRTNPVVYWLDLRTALMVLTPSGSGCKGVEIVGVKTSDLVFFKEGPDTAL